MPRYLRVSIQGSLPGGEIWSVNPVFAPLMPPFTASPAQLVATAQAIATATVPASLLSLLSLNGSITGVRVEAREADFSLVDVGEYFRPVALPGTGAPDKPNQSSVVFSLRTEGVGARQRGRMYWPALRVTLVASTGRISSPTPALISTDASQYLENVSDAIGSVLTGVDTWHPVIYSRVASTSRDVTGVWVGDIVDSQRRRRDNLPESYARAVYPLP